MYFQVLYLKDETYIDKYGIEQYKYYNEFAIVLCDKAKKPFAFVELNYSQFESALGVNVGLRETVSELINLGFTKLATTKSAKKLIAEVEKNTDICYKSIRTDEMRDYYNPKKETIVARKVYNLEIIDLKTNEKLLFLENFYFNMENPSYRIIADGIKNYTMNYYDTKEYEEVCRLEEEEEQRQLQEEKKLAEQERRRQEAIALVREEEEKRQEELVNIKIKELEEQEEQEGI